MWTLYRIQNPKRTKPAMPIPDETRDRWSNRPEPDSGKGAVYWHILFRDDPAVRAAARKAQARLASFRDLHMTPEEWLHATALVRARRKKSLARTLTRCFPGRNSTSAVFNRSRSQFPRCYIIRRRSC